MVQEDPEDFLGDVDDFLAPHAVRSWDVDGRDEPGRLGFFRWRGIVEVREDFRRSGRGWTGG